MLKEEREALKTDAYCAVRTNGSLEFLDTLTLASGRMRLAKRTDEANELTPEWAKRNPVIRVVRVEVKEVKE